MNEVLLRAIVTIVGGALAGGLTNTIAIWMLFHPYRPPRFLGIRIGFLQGAVPKNQARLATAIGGAVGKRLLTEEDLTRVLAEPEFREVFDSGLSRFLNDVLEVERGSVRDLLGPEVMAEAAPIIEDVLDHTISRIERHFHSADFAEAVEARASELADFVADQPVSDILVPGREAEIAAAVTGWLNTAASNDRFHRTVSRYLKDAATRLLRRDITIRDLLPPGMIPTMERAIAGYIPLVIKRLGSLLEQPGPRRRFEQVTRDLMRRFLSDLRFHQRVVARLVINEDTIGKVFRTIQSEGAERIAGMFREPEAEKATAKGISDAIGDLLDRPVADVLGEPDDPGVTETVDAIAKWFAALARDPSARDFLTEKLEAGLARVSERTWGELLEEVSPERVSKWVVTAVRTEVAETVYRDGVRRLASAALERPIGRPARLLPSGATVSIQKAASEPLWRGIQAQIPSVVTRLDIARAGRAKGPGIPRREDGRTREAGDAPRAPHDRLPGLRAGGLHRHRPGRAELLLGLTPWPRGRQRRPDRPSRVGAAVRKYRLARRRCDPRGSFLIQFSRVKWRFAFLLLPHSSPSASSSSSRLASSCSPTRPGAW